MRSTFIEEGGIYRSNTCTSNIFNTYKHLQNKYIPYQCTSQEFRNKIIEKSASNAYKPGLIKSYPRSQEFVNLDTYVNLYGSASLWISYCDSFSVKRHRKFMVPKLGKERDEKLLSALLLVSGSKLESG